VYIFILNVFLRKRALSYFKAVSSIVGQRILITVM